MREHPGRVWLAYVLDGEMAHALIEREPALEMLLALAAALCELS